MTERTNSSSNKSMKEENKDFRLILKGIDLMESRNYEIFLDFVLGDGFANLFITPDFNEKKSMRVYLDEEELLKLHEQLCLVFIHLYDDKARAKLNDTLDKLRV